MICIEYCCERFNPHSQAHLQIAQANTHAKNCKRACLSANARPKNEQNEEKRKKSNKMNCTLRNSIKKKEIWS